MKLHTSSRITFKRFDCVYVTEYIRAQINKKKECVRFSTESEFAVYIAICVAFLYVTKKWMAFVNVPINIPYLIRKVYLAYAYIFNLWMTIVAKKVARWPSFRTGKQNSLQCMTKELPVFIHFLHTCG